MIRISTAFAAALLLTLTACSFDTSGLSGDGNNNSTNNTNSSNNAVCGDNKAEQPEQCDGTDLGGAKCSNIGYDGGQLLCRADCTFDPQLCLTWENCDDGIDNNNDGRVDCDDPQCSHDFPCVDNVYSTQFDASGEYVHTTTFAQILAAAPASFTLSLWIKLWGPQDNWTTILSATGTNSWVDGFGFQIRNKRLSFWINQYNKYVITSLTELEEGVWYHVVGSLDATLPSGNMVLFINGASEASADMTDPVTMPDVPVEIGAINSGRYGFIGCIDEVAIWDVSLGGLSVQDLYNGGHPFNVAQSYGEYTQLGNLRAFWKMGDGDTMPILKDHAGTNDGTLIESEGDEFVYDIP